MERITKRFENGEAYFDGKNGKSTSDNQGRIFGEAAERLAWIEDMIESGNIEEILSAYKDDTQVLSLSNTSVISDNKTVYSVKIFSNLFVDVLYSTEGSGQVRILKFLDGTRAYDSSGNHINIGINEDDIIAFVNDIRSKS
jgi:hypothetical protein